MRAGVWTALLEAQHWGTRGNWGQDVKAAAELGKHHVVRVT